MDTPPPTRPTVSSSSSTASPESDERELSPVVTKLSKLSSRSSFASFFCKSKRPAGKAATGIKPDPLREETIVTGEASDLITGMDNPLGDAAIEVEDHSVKMDPLSDAISNADNLGVAVNVDELVENVQVKTDAMNVTFSNPEAFAFDLSAAPADSSLSTTSKPLTEIISISSSSSDASDSDIQLISTSKRPRSSTTVEDIDCISISSDDATINVNIKKNSTNNIPGKTVTSIPLSDYSKTRPNENFFKPPPIIAASRGPLLAAHVNTSITENVSKATVGVSNNSGHAFSPINTVIPPYTTSSIRPTGTVKATALFSATNYDPSLMDELRTRLSQKSDSVRINEVSINPNGTTDKCSANAVAVSSDIAAIPSVAASESVKVVTFLVIQRLNAATFDASKSLNGQLVPSKSFQIHWRPSDTFGAMKQIIAKNLHTLPSDLVLVNAQSHLELFDTTKPATLNMNGISLQEITARQLQAISSGNTFPPKPESPEVNASKATSAGKKRPSAKASKAANTAATAVALANLQEIAFRLFLYTKSTWSQFKSLHETKKRQIRDSVSFLQTAEAEMSKYQQSGIPTDEPTAEMETESVAFTLHTDFISLNVKTAQSKNQSFPLKLSPTAKVSDILAAFAQAYPNLTLGTRVVFDGDVLKLDKSIDGILENEDMIEIK